MQKLTGVEISEAMANNVKYIVTAKSVSPPLSCSVNTTQYDPQGGGTIIPMDVTVYPQIVQDARQFAMNELVVANIKINTFIPDPVKIGCPRAEFMSKDPNDGGQQLWHDMIYGGFDVRLAHDIGENYVTIHVFEVEDGIQGGSITYQPS